MKAFWFLALLSAFPFIANAESLWRIRQNQPNISLWSAKKNQKITIARHHFKTSQKIRRKLERQEDLFKSVENQKRTMLAWVGVKNWNPSKYEWKGSSDSGVLIIYGTYEDGKGELIGFVEKHTYSRTGETVQDVLTQPLKDQKSEMDPEIVKSFFAGDFL